MKYKVNQEVIIICKYSSYRGQIHKIYYIHESQLAYAIKIPQEIDEYHVVDNQLAPLNKFFRRLCGIDE